ncbi:MAG: hypothetical protein WAN48_11420 [Actinomycetes bacterium]
MELGSLLPPRSVEDILAERIRLEIGGEVYDLPVLTIAENRVWKERMDLELGLLFMQISATDDTDAILGLFDGSESLFMDLLTSYDTTGVLPDQATIEAGLSPLGLIRATLEVWRAARPLADIARTGAMTTPAPPKSASPPPSSSWRRSMAGRLARPAGS